MTRFTRRMNILRSLLEAKEALDRAIQEVVDEAVDADPESSESSPPPTHSSTTIAPPPLEATPSSLPPPPDSKPKVVAELPQSAFLTRALPRVNSKVFEAYLVSAWRAADTLEKKNKVRETVQAGASKGILDAAARTRLSKLIDD